MSGIAENVVRREALERLVGTHPSFTELLRCLPDMAECASPVLIMGETGTGKELFARALHYLGPRQDNPFVPVNSGALPDSLLEAELFGHEKGAFTGASQRRDGLMFHADRGTLFLDEIDSLTLRAQVALLRVLQDRSYRRVGSAELLQSSARIVAATNRPLPKLIEQGEFRADLFYRLDVFSLAVPPLRERGEDILLLARHFLRSMAASAKEVPQLGGAAQQSLMAHTWPGNVRELENVMTRAAHFCRGGVVRAEHLGLAGAARHCCTPVLGGESELPGQRSYGELKRRALEAFDRDYLRRLMRQFNGNITRAARAAGKDRRDLGRLLRKYDLDRTSFG